ncbi:Signal recognition particle receptor FtsY [uncultured archaeon]|nr:Signal recognition particle receptor FtsY [uncultured archaeon]
MFDLLKKKIGGFVDSLSKKVAGERKPEEPAPAEIKAEIEEKAVFELPKRSQAELKPIRDKEAEAATIPPQREEARPQHAAVHEEPKSPEIRPQETVQRKTAAHAQPVPFHYPVKFERPEPKVQIPTKPAHGQKEEKRHEQAAPIPQAPAPQPAMPRESELKQKEFNVAPSLLTKLKSVVMPEVTIKEGDVSSVLEDFEMQLLTADVALPVAEEIAKDVKSKLVGSSVKSSQLEGHVKKAISDSILEVTKQDRFDLFELMAKKEKPLRVLFIGPNGAGKTTAIAKFAHMLNKNNRTCVIAAADTFRAAAIEQTSEHAKRLNVPVIKHDYGSDPAAVAFDAVKYAKAKGIDVVLIDSAGRQETNRNLIEQLKKIERVAQPDLKVFVGEGISGNALLSQVSEFHKAIGLDGVILTKMDVDAKGGTVISIKRATGVPVLYLGIGQGYDDLVAFDSSYIAKRIMAG